MYEIRQAIRDLKEGLAALAVIHERDMVKVDNNYKSILISFKNLEEKVTKKLDNFFQRIGDIESKCMKLQLDYVDKLFNFSKNYVTREEYLKSCSSQEEKFKELNEKLNKKSDFLDTQFISLKSHIRDQVDIVRKEIPSVQEFKPLKKDMEDGFQTLKIDFLGLVKEIALIKKTLAYDQKKFENIYTLIDRLKEDICRKKE